MSAEKAIEMFLDWCDGEEVSFPENKSDHHIEWNGEHGYWIVGNDYKIYVGEAD